MPSAAGGGSGKDKKGACIACVYDKSDTAAQATMKTRRRMTLRRRRCARHCRAPLSLRNPTSNGLTWQVCDCDVRMSDTFNV